MLKGSPVFSSLFCSYSFLLEEILLSVRLYFCLFHVHRKCKEHFRSIDLVNLEPLSEVIDLKIFLPTFLNSFWRAWLTFCVFNLSKKRILCIFAFSANQCNNYASLTSSVPTFYGISLKMPFIFTIVNMSRASFYFFKYSLFKLNKKLRVRLLTVDTFLSSLFSVSLNLSSAGL